MHEFPLGNLVASSKHIILIKIVVECFKTSNLPTISRKLPVIRACGYNVCDERETMKTLPLHESGIHANYICFQTERFSSNSIPTDAP